MKDFRVPVEIFKTNCRLISKSKEGVKNQILKAVGIDINYKEAKVDWD
jgi:hypothetical protein